MTWISLLTIPKHLPSYLMTQTEQDLELLCLVVSWMSGLAWPACVILGRSSEFEINFKYKDDWGRLSLLPFPCQQLELCYQPCTPRSGRSPQATIQDTKTRKLSPMHWGYPQVPLSNCHRHHCPATVPSMDRLSHIAITWIIILVPWTWCSGANLCHHHRHITKIMTERAVTQAGSLCVVH